MRAGTVRHLFVYGTLRQGSPHPKAAWLAERAAYEGRATLAGRLLHLGAYPGLLPATDPTQQVQGDLYFLDGQTDLLEDLDRYEGCHADDPEPHEYCRIVCTASDEDGVRVWCWTYLYQLDAGESSVLVNGDWLSAL